MEKKEREKRNDNFNLICAQFAKWNDSEIAWVVCYI